MSNAQQSEELIRVVLVTRAKIAGTLHPAGAELDVNAAELARGGPGLYRRKADVEAEADAAKIVQTLAQGAGQVAHYDRREQVRAQMALRRTAERITAERVAAVAAHDAEVARAREQGDAEALKHLRPLSQAVMAPPQGPDDARPVVRFTPRAEDAPALPAQRPTPAPALPALSQDHGGRELGAVHDLMRLRREVLARGER